MEAGREGNQSAPGQPRTLDTTSAVQTPQRHAPSQRDPSPTLRCDGSNSQIPAVRKQPSTNLIPSLPTSVAASPQTSRNTSPIRPSVRPQETPQNTAPRAAGIRSRKNSHDASPIRPVSTQSSAAPPSAAAIQRALSAAAVPQLHPNSGAVADAVSKLPRTARTDPATEAQTPFSPSFSPRVKSPGPSAPSSRRNSVPRKLDNLGAPPITVQNSTPPGTAVPDLKGDGSGESGLTQTPKISNRGPSGPKSSLETVQEATPPANSVLGDSTDQSFHSMNSSQTKSSDDDRITNGAHSKKDGGNRSGESDGDGNRSDGKGKKEPLTIDQNKAKLASSKSAPATARTKQVDGTRNMTVETETVSSIPQSALSADRAAGPRGDPGGSIRLKPSNETIRPRKERKKAIRKAPSVHNGTASSKADIFEARVASQVDEANSSDSDETFVYESNPPEPQLRTNRNHSRTPSVTSIHSQSDRRLNLRAGYDNHRVAGKRSMKFSNNPYSALDSPTDDATGMGTIRAHHPRNISRFGRTIGSNSSLYGGGEDSPFTQASKLRANLAAGGGQGTRHSSRPNTPSQPKSAPAANQRFGPWRKDVAGLRQYDYDDAGEEGSDERTPLVGTVRTPRRYQRRRERQSGEGGIYNLRQEGFLGKCGGCVLGAFIFALVVSAAVGTLFMSNRALEEVQVERIQNVLASEQEIMLDLVVGAVNPNILGVGVGEMDLNVFAKSKFVATTSREPVPTATAGPERGATAQRRRTPRDSKESSDPTTQQAVGRGSENDQVGILGQPWQDKDGHWHSGDDDSLEGDSQTMLLGRVFHFDQGLYFEGTPLRHRRHLSTGEFRLAKPGNKTEAGGSARWERVLGYPFELILRGVVRYRLPLSNRDMSAAVRGSVVVHPEEGVRGGRMRVEPVEEHERGLGRWDD